MGTDGLRGHDSCFEVLTVYSRCAHHVLWSRCFVPQNSNWCCFVGTRDLLFTNGLVGSAALCRHLSSGAVLPGVTPLLGDPPCHILPPSTADCRPNGGKVGGRTLPRPSVATPVSELPGNGPYFRLHSRGNWHCAK